jgi:dihydroneopterin aldolase
MDDIVFIEALQVDALIGVHDWERHAPRPLVLDLELGFDNRIPAASDRLADTLDYDAISRRLREYAAQTAFELVESLAEQCAALVLAEFGASRVRLKLSKPGAVEHARAVGVIIERRR